MPSYIFSSESVGRGHPDKLCDQVSDAVLDACLREDPYSKVACETCSKTGLVMIFGEITTSASVKYQDVVRKTLLSVGYDDAHKGLDGHHCSVLSCIEEQSAEIAEGVHGSGEQDDDPAAGDQGIMFGYATDETEEKMPLTLVIARNINRRLEELAKDGTLDWVRPDSQSQVSIEYDTETHEPIRIHTVLVSAQHKPDLESEQLYNDVLELVIKPLLPQTLVDDSTKFIINPSGKFTVGGPHADSGLTGRKIIVDTYGGAGSHGGGAFSGKDPTKVDRSAAYASRQIAKSIVVMGLAKRALVQLSYGIGVKEPISVFVNTYGTGTVPDSELTDRIKSNVDLTPGGIIRRLNLRRPIYEQTAQYGHFGNPDFPWEKTIEF